MATKKKTTRKAPQVSAPREPENADAADVDRSKPGDASVPAPLPGAAVAKQEDVSKAAVVEPNNVDEDEKGNREERVIATRTGYYGHKRREAGEVFIMHFKGKKGFLPSWVRLAEDDDVPTRRVETKPGKFEDVDVLDNAIPYAEGGNVVKPDAGGRSVI